MYGPCISKIRFVFNHVKSKYCQAQTRRQFWIDSDASLNHNPLPRVNHGQWRAHGCRLPICHLQRQKQSCWTRPSIRQRQSAVVCMIHGMNVHQTYYAKGWKIQTRDLGRRCIPQRHHQHESVICMVSYISLMWHSQLKDSSRRIGFHTYYSMVLQELGKPQQFLRLHGEYTGLIIENKYLRYVLLANKWKRQ